MGINKSYTLLQRSAKNSAIFLEGARLVTLIERVGHGTRGEQKRPSFFLNQTGLVKLFEITEKHHSCCRGNHQNGDKHRQAYLEFQGLEHILSVPALYVFGGPRVARS